MDADSEDDPFCVPEQDGFAFHDLGGFPFVQPPFDCFLAILNHGLESGLDGQLMPLAGA